MSFVSNHNNNRFITVNHRHYCSKNYKEPLENREIEGSGERIGGFFEWAGGGGEGRGFSKDVPGMLQGCLGDGNPLGLPSPTK